MKIIIASVLIAISSISFAMRSDEVLVAKNQLDGVISLMYDECPISYLRGSKIAITTDGKMTVFGCWISDENKIHVLWFPENSPSVKVDYDFGEFKLEKIL